MRWLLVDKKNENEFDGKSVEKLACFLFCLTLESIKLNGLEQTICDINNFVKERNALNIEIPKEIFNLFWENLIAERMEKK